MVASRIPMPRPARLFAQFAHVGFSATDPAGGTIQNGCVRCSPLFRDLAIQLAIRDRCCFYAVIDSQDAEH